MIDIYDEVRYIKEVLEHGFSDKWERDATLLVKYYKSQNPPMKKSEVKQIIKAKCKKYVANYNENVTYKRVNKLIDTTWKNWKVDKKNPDNSSKLREIRYIEFPREVLDWFLNLDQFEISSEQVKELKLKREKISITKNPINLNRAKYLFTLFVWTKIQEQQLTRPNMHYLKKYVQKFKRDADLKASFNMQKERNLLYDLGFIYINHALGIDATFMQQEVFKTPVTDENRILLSGEDLYFCGYWLEKQKYGSFVCVNCLKEVANKKPSKTELKKTRGKNKGGRPRKYCEECAKKMNGITLSTTEKRVERSCEDCGKVIEVSKYSSKTCLCSECREKRHKLAQKKYIENTKKDLPS